MPSRSWDEAFRDAWDLTARRGGLRIGYKRWGNQISASRIYYCRDEIRFVEELNPHFNQLPQYVQVGNTAETYLGNVFQQKYTRRQCYYIL